MALSTFRWVGAAAVACAAIAAAYLPPNAPRSESTLLTTAQVRARATERALRSALNAHQLEARRDELLAAAAARPGDSILIVGGEADTSIVRLIRAEWALVRAANGPVRPAIVLENAPTAAVAGVRIPPVTRVTMLPGATGGTLCAAVVRPYVKKAGWWMNELRRSLGPCAFVARYGLPGPHIAEWLEARQYDVARTTRLSGDGDGGTLRRFADDARLPMPFRLLGFEPEDEMRSLDAVACLRGDAARCKAAILSDRPAPPLGLIPGVSAAGRWQNGFSGAEETYLADLARAIGSERFTRFWKSDASVEAAFQGAVGEPIGVWTRDWAGRRLGRNSASVQLSTASAAQGLLAALLLSGLAALLARARQVR